MGVVACVWLRERNAELVVVLTAVIYRTHIAEAVEEDEAEYMEEKNL